MCDLRRGVTGWGPRGCASRQPNPRLPLTPSRMRCEEQEQKSSSTCGPMKNMVAAMHRAPGGMSVHAHAAATSTTGGAGVPFTTASTIEAPAAVSAAQASQGRVGPRIVPPAKAHATLQLRHAAKPSDHRASPFAELGVPEIAEGIGRTRVRQHVNPLSLRYQAPTPVPDWSALFADPTAPLALDLGCGPGRFLLLHRKRRADAGEPAWNYLGLEIRKPLVERANEWSRRLGYQQDVHFLSTNATVSLATLLSSYPGPMPLVTVQFPDPHFKRRHHKRRMVQPQLVRDVAGLLPPGGRLFLQSDVLPVAVAMRNAFEKHAGPGVLELAAEHLQPGAVFHEEPARGGQTPVNDTGDASQEQVYASINDSEAEAQDGGESGGSSDEEEEDIEAFASQWAAAGWLQNNPIGTPTERELYVQQQGLPVYRVLLVRKP